MNSSPNRSLLLQSYDGQDIPNAIAVDPSPRMIALNISAIDRMVLATATQLTRPTGRYNCHGLVFGARRTGIGFTDIDEQIDIKELLVRDRYVKIQPPYKVGDVVIYIDPKTSTVEHSGIVCRIDKVAYGIELPYIWSKWGILGEYMHPCRPAPYPFQDCIDEYWRLKQQ